MELVRGCQLEVRGRVGCMLAGSVARGGAALCGLTFLRLTAKDGPKPAYRAIETKEHDVNEPNLANYAAGQLRLQCAWRTWWCAALPSGASGWSVGGGGTPERGPQPTSRRYRALVCKLRTSFHVPWRVVNASALLPPR